MAKATVQLNTPVPTPPPVESITLVLSLEEATVIRALVGVSPASNSTVFGRGVQSVYEALTAVGIDRDTFGVDLGLSVSLSDAPRRKFEDVVDEIARRLESEASRSH